MHFTAKLNSSYCRETDAAVAAAVAIAVAVAAAVHKDAGEQQKNA